MGLEAGKSECEQEGSREGSVPEIISYWCPGRASGSQALHSLRGESHICPGTEASCRYRGRFWPVMRFVVCVHAVLDPKEAPCVPPQRNFQTSLPKSVMAAGIWLGDLGSWIQGWKPGSWVAYIHDSSPKSAPLGGGASGFSTHQGRSTPPPLQRSWFGSSSKKKTRKKNLPLLNPPGR